MVCMIVVDARIVLVPEQKQMFEREVQKIMPRVRWESGCTRYELVADVSSPLVMHFLEEWESQQHLDNHLNELHMQEFFAKTATCHAAPTELKIYEVLSSRSITMA
ncbi:putative quinol monooxygenase [uncultured Methanoregula sp.]|uniref:putative quinol monooxygenase n=1 Tax=uncultured Methanoregula sp. TaxID=1005933 RepID=UPI002AAB5BEA|nr:putative quinol monooxygenase [uncultured Methanoregula sp.]